MDIYSSEASRKKAILAVKKKLPVNWVVVFGNNVRDREMLEFADEGYVVENADEELKAIAISIKRNPTHMCSLGKLKGPNVKFGLSLIGNNDSDSVVKIKGVCYE